MALVLHPGFLVNLAGALVVVGLGVFVASVRPRGAANVAFAAWGISFGLAYAFSNVPFLVTPEDPVGRLARMATTILSVPAAVLFLFLALRFPRVLSPRERRFLLAPALLLSVHVAYVAVLLVMHDASANARLGFTGWQEGFTPALLQGTIFAGLALFAVRAAEAEDERVLRQYALASAAFLVYAGFLAGVLVMPERASDPTEAASPTRLFGALLLAEAAAIGLLWLRNTRGVDPRASRNVALVSFAAPLGGMTLVALLGGQAAVDAAGTYGIARTLAVGILAYAILRHQLLDIDLKLKFTLRQSTVAAAFIGLFFVVSESAQQFFSDRTGTYVGIVAAGALVFAIAPLQRFAGHVADRAMPGVEDSEGWRKARRAEVYRFAVRVALADGAVSRAEERRLADLAAHLGLEYPQALRLREEVEAELEASGFVSHEAPQG